ncbi:MAG: NAD(P)-binding protein [Vampirovibrionales bacterium]|nr:NAD(P)-binding protein [Vampirovibrionales bacterium]
MNSPETDLSRIVIIGGGTTGLLAAALLSKWLPDKRITLIEKGESLGGLLRSFDYGENGRFDYGAHNFQETLIPEIDDLFLNLIPVTDWHILPGAKREIAGNYFCGKLNFNSPFFNLTHLDKPDYESCVGDFFINLNGENGAINTTLEGYPENAYEFSMIRYGEAITEKIIRPAIQKLFSLDLELAHRLPMLFLPLSRVAFLRDDTVCDLTRSEILRERIAYTNQRDLPLERSSGKRIFYPKTLGMQQMIDGFEKLLISQGVEIIKSAMVTGVTHDKGNVNSLTLNTGEAISVEHLFWTAGIHPLAKTFDLMKPEDSFDPPLKTVFIHYQLDHRPKLEDIYFLYPFDPEFMTYRVVNYANYCPQAAEGPHYPVTLEMFLSANSKINKENLMARGLEELKKMGVVPGEARAIFSVVESTAEGFPMPTMKNMVLTKTRRERIQDLKLKNLNLLGILSKDELLFHKDIILDTYHQVKSYAEEFCLASIR